MVDDETSKSKDQVADSEDASKGTDTEGSERDTQSTDSSTGEGKKASEGEKGKDNVQAAIQRAREAENAALDRARKAEKELRERKLSKMTEADKWKAIAQENAEKAAKLELKSVVSTELSKNGIIGPVADLILRTPWSIPGVQEELGDSPTWEDTIAAVQKHLPGYLQSLATSLKSSPKSEDKEEKSEGDTTSSKVDEENSAPPVKEHSYTRAEIAELRKDPVLWAKVKDKVLADLAKHGGILPS